MLQFNLLPWRIWQAQQRKRIFFCRCILIVIIISILTLVFYTFLAFNTKTHKIHNDYLQKKIISYQPTLTKLEKTKCQLNNLIIFLKSLAKLQERENQLIKILNFINQKLPLNVYYTSVKYKNKILNLSGNAKSNTEINQLLEIFRKFRWLNKKKIKIRQDKTNTQYPYNFNFIINEV